MIKNAEKVASAVEDRWPTAGLPEKDKFAFRGQVARELLEGESTTYQIDLGAEVEAEHARSIEAFETQQEVHAQTVKTSEETQAKYVTCRH